MKFCDNCYMDKIWKRNYKKRQVEEIRLFVQKGEKPGKDFKERATQELSGKKYLRFTNSFGNKHLSPFKGHHSSRHKLLFLHDHVEICNTQMK